MPVPKPSRNLIYGLLDPSDRCLRYVGKTHRRREIRLQEHLDEATLCQSSDIYAWVRRLLNEGLSPEIFVLERIPGEKSWQEAEKKWISFWRNGDRLQFPYCHPPQTVKSHEVVINSVALLNRHKGGDIRHRGKDVGVQMPLFEHDGLI
jgi:hypothetical protein